ncbi:MAG: hypothetical protein JRF63_07865, partial [Deltaproteobacteria bacterium]|nr:hypothetical protein [Deltaproteobacteria bacterium]
MNLKPAMIGTALAIALAAPSGAAHTRDEATHRFSIFHPDAQFVDDGASHRYYIVHGFAATAGDGLVEGVREFARAHSGLLGLADHRADLVFDRVEPFRSDSFVKFDQTFDGKPVFGAKIIVQVDAYGDIVKLNSTAAAEPQPLRGKLIGPTAAADSAMSMVSDAGPPSQPVLGYLPVEGLAIPVYLVVVPAPGPHLWFTYVDAVSGSVLLRQDQVLRHDAEVYEENPTSNYDTDLVTLENIVTEGEHTYHTYGDYIRVAKCNVFDNGECTSHTFQAEATDEDGFLDYEAVHTANTFNDGFSEVQCYWSLDTYYTWLRDEFGFAPQFVDAETSLPGQSMWIYVNMNFENGFFMAANDYYGNPDLIALGQGAKDYAYDNDISRHEFTHAVSSQVFEIWYPAIDNMGCDFSGQGIEEGTADYFPCSYHNSSVLGEYMGIGRDLDNDDICPDDLWGEGHNDGQIMGGALWDIRSGLNATKVDTLQYGALLGNSMLSFSQWAEAFKMQAFLAMSDEDPDYQLSSAEFEIVEDVLLERQLEFCERAVPIEHGGWAFHYMAYALATNGTPSAVQGVISSLEDTETLEMEIEPFGDSYRVLVRKDEPVYFTWSQ